MDVGLPRGTACVVRRDGAAILKTQCVVNGDRITIDRQNDSGITEFQFRPG